MRIDTAYSATGLLLPERRRLPEPAPAAIGRLLARAEAFDCVPGEQAQLQRWFWPEGGGWPMAAIQRQADSGDAGGGAWVRADPVHVRAEMAGARLMAWDTLGLTIAESDALVACVAPSFSDEGIDIGRTAPERWYLRLPPGMALPTAAAAPCDALGEDVFAHLPAGGAGRTWRRLQSEAQIALTQHPINVARWARGASTANSVWFWGEGVLPRDVHARFDGGAVVTRDPQLAALAGAAGQRVLADDDGQAGLVDLRAARHWEPVERALAPRLPGALAAGLMLDFADAPRLRCRPLRWWQRRG